MADAPGGAPFADEALLLLKAALLPRDGALAAYRQWRARFDIDAIGPGPMRLLPLVHANIAAAAHDDPRLGRLKGIRKYWWLRNQLLEAGAAAALRTLAARGIPAILLKGAAMIAFWYRDAALRPMGDVDLLVRPADARAAIRALAASGWTPIGGTVDALCELHVDRLHAWNFASSKGQSLDLHWRALHQAQQAGADDPLWHEARSCVLAGAPTAVLAPADQLFHVVAHGLQAAADDAFMWPADAAWIVRGETRPFDWQRVVALASRARLSLQLAAGLRFLREELAVPVDEAAIAALARHRTGWLDRREFVQRRRPPAERSRFDAALLEFQDFRRRGDLIARPAVAAVLPFAQDRWRLDRAAAVPGYVLAAALGRPALLKRLWLVRPRARRIAALRPLPLPRETLAFAGALDDTLVHGWHVAEQGGRWTDGAEAVLAFALAEPPAGNLVLRADAMALLSGGPQQQEIAIDVWVGTHFAARWRASAQRGWLAPCTCAIPPAWLAGGGRLVVTFVIRRPCRPADIGASADRRRLGLFVRTLTIAPA